VPIKRAISGGAFFTINTTTATGTKKSQPLMLKVDLILARIVAVSATPEVSMVKPRTTKAIRAIEIVGTVVRAIYRIWENSSPPTMAGAKLVVSLKGDILSPK